MLDPRYNAPYHMSGSRAAFANVNTGVIGSVHFGDGSIAQIEGLDTMLFLQEWRARLLPNVYFLPCLTANIIFIGQLDEGRY